MDTSGPCCYVEISMIKKMNFAWNGNIYFYEQIFNSIERYIHYVRLWILQKIVKGVIYFSVQDIRRIEQRGEGDVRNIMGNHLIWTHLPITPEHAPSLNYKASPSTIHVHNNINIGVHPIFTLNILSHSHLIFFAFLFVNPYLPTRNSSSHHLWYWILTIFSSLLAHQLSNSNKKSREILVWLRL